MSLIVFADVDLMPQRWLAGPLADVALFNPALTCFQGHYLLCYRVVTPDGRRRLALCRLTPTLTVEPGSVVPFSDSITDGGDWHADARFCHFGERLFLHYNDGARQPNHIYWVEIDPERLVACGPAREVLLAGPRRAVEKNWMFFEHAGELWAIYTIAPHVVLKVAWTEHGPLVCQPVYQQAWTPAAYTTRYGELRGGAPPVRVGDHYVAFCHSTFPVRPFRRLLWRLLRKGPDKCQRYVGGVYTFAAAPPFAPLALQPTPILWPPPLPRRHQPQLDRRIERSAYPCGTIFQQGQWVVSFGAQEEYCCLATLDNPLSGLPSAVYRCEKAWTAP